MRVIPKEIRNARMKFLMQDAKDRKAAYKKYDDMPTEFWACDFECTTLEPFKVYMAMAENIVTGEYHFFETIDEFLELFKLGKEHVLWFHNGKKYDEHFIRAAAYRLNLDIIENKSLTLHFPQPLIKVDKRNGKLPIDKKTAEEKIIPVSNTVKILDTRQLINKSLAKIGESLGPEFQKGGSDKVETPLIAYINSDTDWAETIKEKPYIMQQGELIKTKLIEHKDSFKEACEANKWLEYARQDVRVLAEAIRQFGILDDYNNKVYTAAGKAWKTLKELSPEYDMIIKEEANFMSKNSEAKTYYDREMRYAKKAYKGGISWVNQKYAKRIMKNKGYVLDYTSMYPSIYMQSDKYPLPAHVPCRKGEVSDLYIINFEYLDMTCKKGKFPLAKMRTDEKGENSKHYNPIFKGPVTFTSPEWEYIQENYIIHKTVGITQVFYARNKKLEAALRAHGEHWYKEKEQASINGDEVKREIAKLQLNSCYGYLGFYKSPKPRYYYKIDNNGKLTKNRYEEDAYPGLTVAEVPAAAFVTAYGRVKLANDINKLGIYNVVATDTDSVFVINLSLKDICKKVNVAKEDKLGWFKIEKEFYKIIAIKPKTYCITDKQGNILKQASAGCNFKFKRFENFRPGQQFINKKTFFGAGGVGIYGVISKLGEVDEEESENDYIEFA